MSNFASFVFGTLVGAYLSQNYNLPDVKNTLTSILEHIKEFEENNRNKK